MNTRFDDNMVLLGLLMFIFLFVTVLLCFIINLQLFTLCLIFHKLSNYILSASNLGFIDLLLAAPSVK